jgi:arylsulfatase
MVIGAFFGYAAASGGLDSIQPGSAIAAPAGGAALFPGIEEARRANCSPEFASEGPLFARDDAKAVAEVAEGQNGGKKPNFLVIFGDDIGQTNVSAYSMGLMGYRTPNIDRIAKEGMIFTDYYAEQSCTAGRSSFITGQCTFRTGLSKVGMPAATVGLQIEDPTIAELLKNHARRRGNSARTTWATGMNIYPPCTDSTSSSATCIT